MLKEPKYFLSFFLSLFFMISVSSLQNVWAVVQAKQAQCNGADDPCSSYNTNNAKYMLMDPVPGQSTPPLCCPAGVTTGLTVTGPNSGICVGACSSYEDCSSDEICQIAEGQSFGQCSSCSLGETPCQTQCCSSNDVCTATGCTNCGVWQMHAVAVNPTKHKLEGDCPICCPLDNQLFCYPDCYTLYDMNGNYVTDPSEIYCNNPHMQPMTNESPQTYPSPWCKSSSAGATQEKKATPQPKK